MPFRYSFKTKTDLAKSKTKAPPDSSLYGPYQALSSSNPSLQASFTGIAIRKGQTLQMNSNLDNLVGVVPLCHCDADDN
ncbi:hypothetical protein SO802_015693 [Lithocarpus litseifolius]|uniref:Uncharacterized protein n=1 Tax=Lithocarpus litseifolius TaxID=425828 RepID=A0AAW2CUE1_9ROSI